MKHWLVDLLRSPGTGERLHLVDARVAGGEIESGRLVTPDGARSYPIVNAVPRFVPSDNYAASFGLQWNRFRRTQLDSYTGVPISRDQLFSYSGWTREQLAGRLVLDVGCGAGRFTEVALAAGAEVVALDYSTAVDACWQNHQGHPRLNVLQADIYRLPFDPGRFDFVYCIGVLQHTPDVRAAFMALGPQLRPGGELTVGIYPKIALNLLWSKYWLRPITKRLPPDRLFRLVERAVPILLPISRALGRIPGVGRKLRWAIPVANHESDFPLSDHHLREWAVLNTFDMFAPAHDSPQSAATLTRWLDEAELDDVWVGRRGFLVGRGRKPQFSGRSRRMSGS